MTDETEGGRYIVLVIDDAPETLGLVSDALEGNGMTVLVARSGEEGLRLTRRVQPDVILLDAMMPGMDGFETCRRLKTPPNSESAPVIFMTGLTEGEHILAGLRAGGVDYVTKPVVVDELIARITRHVMNARAIQMARAALDYTGQNVIGVLPDGRLSWGTRGALARIGADFAEGRASDRLLFAEVAREAGYEELVQIAQRAGCIHESRCRSGAEAFGALARASGPNWPCAFAELALGAAPLTDALEIQRADAPTSFSWVLRRKG